MTKYQVTNWRCTWVDIVTELVLCAMLFFSPNMLCGSILLVLLLRDEQGHLALCLHWSFCQKCVWLPVKLSFDCHMQLLSMLPEDQLPPPPPLFFVTCCFGWLIPIHLLFNNIYTRTRFNETRYKKGSGVTPIQFLGTTMTADGGHQCLLLVSVSLWQG